MRRNTSSGKLAAGRTCAPCNLCCIHLQIESKPGFSTRTDTGEELAKAPGDPCRYLTREGCGIYEHRPAVCRQFACDWLIGEKTFQVDETPLKTATIGVRGARLHLAQVTIDTDVFNLDTDKDKDKDSQLHRLTKTS